jgi:hypothetical protein
MKPVILPFLRKLIVFSAILSVIAVLLILILPSSCITPALPFMFIFFPLVTLASFYILVKATAGRFIRFLNYFLGTTMIKLFIYIGLIVVYALLNKKDAIPFVLSFFILYVFYTSFEVIQIISHSRKEGKT